MDTLTVPKPTTAFFLDVAKVFANVWHNGLVHKLRKLGLLGRSVTCYNTFSETDTFVYASIEHSSSKLIKAGNSRCSLVTRHRKRSSHALRRLRRAIDALAQTPRQGVHAVANTTTGSGRGESGLTPNETSDILLVEQIEDRPLN
ncbi:hypothetical protein EVAR_80876_1 [Eumeta japonica]|uniref:Reverse transcriptase domain-containing protein n=1 Tax=Eumeta variegata TaxID=151549 RepID=A0A4C1V0S6_EUMVA|nr:hypothetical protein EVAR_80876_1 [Eumeta japonica]